MHLRLVIDLCRHPVVFWSITGARRRRWSLRAGSIKAQSYAQSDWNVPQFSSPPNDAKYDPLPAESHSGRKAQCKKNSGCRGSPDRYVKDWLFWRVYRFKWCITPTHRERPHPADTEEHSVRSLHYEAQRVGRPLEPMDAITQRAINGKTCMHPLAAFIKRRTDNTIDEWFLVANEDDYATCAKASPIVSPLPSKTYLVDGFRVTMHRELERDLTYEQ